MRRSVAAVAGWELRLWPVRPVLGDHLLPVAQLRAEQDDLLHLPLVLAGPVGRGRRGPELRG